MISYNVSDKEMALVENPGFKRSRWPEAESIRNATGQRLDITTSEGINKKHPELPHPPESFPRAEFGLPIIFEFKDSETKLEKLKKDLDLSIPPQFDPEKN